MTIARDDSPGVAIAGARLFEAVLRPLQAFFRLEAASGLALLGCAVAAFAWANLDHESYQLVFATPVTLGVGGVITRFSVLQLVNDGLMTLFFFVVGMEIKRELVLGELRTLPQALLPAIAALGGMLVPAGIFLAFNAGGPGAPGWGIPMATDIAFCIGVLTLLRSRVPHALIVFVTALAIFDDIGGILVIALFYGTGIDLGWLLAAAGVTVASAVMSRAHVRNGVVWTIAGALLWYTLHHSGIHATIAGVILGLAIPARPRRPLHDVIRELSAHTAALTRGRDDDGRDEAAVHAIEERLEELEAPLTRFVHSLHPWVAFGIMPSFALANSGVHLSALDPSQWTGRIAVGTAVALFVGKQAGIFAFTMVSVGAGVARLPGGSSRPKLLGVSIVAGIGFTVALFIAGLAYPGRPHLLDEAKLGILAGSLVSGVVGALILRSTALVEARGREPIGAAAAPDKVRRR
jgi:NhaA family Na+:H+ antiporter